ncbi:glycosyltransferase [Altererythrobacter salegens]|uniref:Glycosyltransferase n=1 Tax=Croceibacterium salegens TaxID=1737568 RepID=A0A6I4SWS7_9SPHN|nr:glycosyltransferase [Croceibacterium salegens]MXO59497.1 glycosyltransferase [Croceibacterium salegens]
MRLLSLATLYPNPHTPRFGTFVARSLEALAARGDWQVCVINPIGLPPLLYGHYKELAQAAQGGRENGVEVFRPTFRLLPGLSGNINPAAIAKSVLPLARSLHAAAPFDLVDAQFFYPDGPAAARIAADLGVPLAMKARGADISYWGQRSSPLRQMRAAAGRATRLLAVSEALANDMEALGFPPDKVRVHYTGLDRDLFRPLDRIECRRRAGEHFGFALPAGAPLLSCVGALIERKGQAMVIEALPALPAAHLLLVGTGPDEANLRALADGIGVTDRVHFLGSLDHTQLPVLLSASDAMVLPSASEGLANAWVEALACGCPLVITEAGGARELVRSATAGRIVQRSAWAIAAGIRDILSAPLDRDKVAAAVETFSWPAHAEALAEIYEEIVAPR